MEFAHTSVLLTESIDWLLGKKDGIYVDCTLGAGGHSRALAEQLTQDALLVGLDQDGEALAAAAKNLAQVRCRTKFVQANFRDVAQVLDELGLPEVDGIFFDLGVSSYQLDNPLRGFSYMQDGPLDMRMNQDAKLDAAYIVNNYAEDRLRKIIADYGEERWSKRIAEFIVRAREEKPLATTFELVSVIKKAVPKGARLEGPHPAKRTFQAIRIEVNDELGILAATLEKAVSRLKSGGKVGVITFHSLEDRIIKQTLAQLAKGCICPPDLPFCVCGKKPVVKKPFSVKPAAEEIEHNPRARSARLRGAMKI